ncbi:CP family cyanate transporter-like MFS transporter [Streptosporangium becharense]|uniref:CP family cyanate transporter-like MFS transporter n=1 Tax=Streptosporangium becharense TaxID=1816182 RepID=A0A7W9IJS3_9ACTN|nr:MFS transporter [Streptosporangium becharense]MBB2911371.1 CP family cyanate transporter-like MFS transporter [Streptosporangium becharense]MBB5821571.1 CP family cyanate transporter-like MFS transporter [Streptosporangium becharense]
MSRVLLVAGFVLAALNLRPALAGVSPVLGEIMEDLGLSAAGGGAITTVMVVCLGVLGPLAPLLARRFGLDRTLLAGLILLAAGVALRSAGGVPALYAGAAVAGAAIAVMNVVMPGVVKQHFPARVGFFTAVYVSGLVVGAAAASGLMVPLERATGYGWREVTAMAAIPALAAAALWLPQALRRPERPQDAPRPFAALLRSRVTWYVTVFMGLQSLTFYIVLAWLPTIFRDAGLPADQAGYLLSLTNLSQVAATLTVPVLAGRSRSQVSYVTAATVLTAAGYAGVLVAPATLPWLWMVVLGLGQGASIALALLIITLRAPDPVSVTALSAVAQSVGYVLAALGPFLIGALHELSGDWTLPLLVALGACGLQLVAGFLAGRPGLAVGVTRPAEDPLPSR